MLCANSIVKTYNNGKTTIMTELPMFSAMEDLDVHERELIFSVHSISELIESKNLDFYTFCKHLAHGLRYKDPELQECLELMRLKRTEDRYFNGK